MAAYYNENDRFAAEWLRQLIAKKVIADGEVDERSIEEVQPEDLEGFTQCHFFAGIGVWSYSLRCAGWRDDRPVWTGSCPCPSFSAAGQGKGFDDPRHLWPELFRLTEKRRPAVLFGEQVDDAIGHWWLDVVQDDLESAGYAVAKAVFGACSVGAPQIGQRLYFVAEATESRRARPEDGRAASQDARERTRCCESERSLAPSRVAATDGRQPSDGELQRSGKHGLFAEDSGAGELEQAEERGFRVCGSAPGSSGRIAQPESTSLVGSTERERLEGHARNGNDGNEPGRLIERTDRPVTAAGPTNGFWRDAEWLYCTDGKYRPVEPKYVKMTDGSTDTMGYMCSAGEAVPEEEIDASQKANADKVLLSVQQEVGTEGHQREIGGSGNLPAQEVLQPELYGSAYGRADQGFNRSKFAQAIRKESKEGMRSVLEKKRIIGSSQRRKSQEQREIEFADFVRLLPSSCAFAELYGDAATKEALCSLLGTDATQRIVRDPFITPQEIWRSLGKEGKNRLRMGFDSGIFVRTFEHPLAHGYPNRAGTLRGYGNAIVAPQAAEFIKAYMESTK